MWKLQIRTFTTRTRIIPTLPTFYSANPVHENNINRLEYLWNKYSNLPRTTQVNTNTQSPQKQNRVQWLSFDDYRSKTGSGVRLKPTQYDQLIYYLNKLNSLDKQLINNEIQWEINQYHKSSSSLKDLKSSSSDDNNNDGVYRIPDLDQFGRATAVGRRKSASARCWTVRGQGQILINNRPLNDYFVNIKDRHSILYPLRVIDQMGQFNIFALTSGGGTTGQADAVALALAKSLLSFNPLWKSRLQRADCITTDYRRVERKKPGKLKARKMPTWVKR